MSDDDAPDPIPEQDPDEELLYSAEIVHDRDGYRLYLRDHTTGLLLSTLLTAKAVADLPKYAAMLKLRPVA